MRTQVKHYAFARESLTRRTIHPDDRKSCDWCGSKPGKFAYSITTDWGRDNDIDGAFCCVDCMKAYHDFDDTGM